MKNLAMMFVTMSMLVGFAYDEPSPRQISVQMPTEQSIQEGIKLEQKYNDYNQAIRIARQTYRRNGCNGDFADATGRVAVDLRISPRVLSALVFVESSCNPNAVSGRRSVGLTQINPLVWKYTQAELRDPEINLRIGATILSAYVRKFGLIEGLHHYNGLGNPTNSYAEKVLTAAGLKS